MNRYTKLTYNDATDLPLPQIPFEALGKVLESYQKQQDIFDSASEAGFKSLESESDKELAKQVRGYQSKLVDDLSKKYMEGNTKDYMQSLRSGIKNMISLRKPGGPIAALESRYSQYQKVMEDLKEKYKDDEAVDNYMVAKSMVNIGDVGYNPDAGTYNSITAPTIQNYQDNFKRIEEMVKQIHPEIKSITRFENGYVFTDTGKKYYVQDAVDSLMNSPEFKAQTLISAKYQLLTMSDESKNELVLQLNEKNAAIVDNAKTIIQSISDKITSGNPKLVKEGKAELKSRGYDVGGISSTVDAKTQAALDKMIADIEEQASKYKTDNTVDDLLGSLVQSKMNEYKKYAGALVKDSIETEYNGADWKAQYAYKKSMVDQLIQATMVPERPEIGIGALANSQIDYIDNINELEGQLKSLDLEIIKGMSTLYENGTFPKNIDDVTKMYDYYLRNNTSEGFAEDYMSRFGVSKDMMDKQIAFFKSNNSVKSQLQARAAIQEDVNSAKNFILNRNAEYIKQNKEVPRKSILGFSQAIDNLANGKNFGNVYYENGIIKINNNGNVYNTGLKIEDIKNVRESFKKDGLYRIPTGQQMIEAMTAYNSGVFMLTNHFLEQGVKEEGGFNLTGESVNYYLEANYFDEGIFGDVFTNIVKNNGEGTMLDIATGEEMKWVDDDGNEAKDIVQSSITTKAGTFNGKPIIVAMATDKEGVVYKKHIDLTKVAPINKQAFFTELDVLAKDLYATGQYEEVKQVIPILNPIEAQTALVINNTKSTDSGNSGFFKFNDTVYSGKYTVLEKTRMRQKDGSPFDIAVIAMKGADNIDKYYMVDMNNNEIMNDSEFGYTSPAQAIYDLRYAEYISSIPQGYVPTKQLKKGQNTVSESNALITGISTIFND